MSRRVAGSVAAGVLVVASSVMASPAEAAVVEVVGVSGGATCEAVFGAGGRCFLSGGKVTATLTGGDTINIADPVTAFVGDTITIVNQSGPHNMVFCKPGTVIPNSFNRAWDWNCGDPIRIGGPSPGGDISASGAGAPQMIGYPWEGKTFPYSTTLTEAGDFFFWCGVGDHRYGGQFGKLVVKPAPPTTSTAAPATTSSTPAITSAPSGASPTSSPAGSGATATAPTMSLKKSRGKVTASGRTSPRARVSLQRLSGSRWVTVARATASSTGTYVVTVRAESKATTYRVVVGSRASTSKRI